MNVSTEDVRAARVALLRLRTDHAALVRWIEDGHPRLTDTEHVRRFGAPYRAARSKPR